MHEAQLCNSRKRPNPESQTIQEHHISKKQKRGHTSGSQFPPAFWDNLSKVHLTKNALEEQDRRNTQATLHSRRPCPQLHRPITRSALAERRKGSEPLTPAVDYLRHCGREILKRVKQTARRGGPDLSHLRGLLEPLNSRIQEMNPPRSNSRVPNQSSRSTSNTRPSTTTSTTKSTGVYDRNFQQKLIDGGIYPPAYRYPDGRVPPRPDNWEEIQRRLSQSRPSLSPSRFSEEDYESFVQADAHALKEKQVTTSVIPIIDGKIEDPKCVSGGIPFTNLDPLTDDTLKSGNPDVYYGARPEQLDRRVRDELSGHIVPSTQNDLPILPNFFLAVKGPDGSLAVAGRQTCHDITLGTRGIHSLQSHGQENSSYDNNAYTIASIYHGGQLKMYTSHATRSASPGSRPEYYMHQLNTWGMTGNIETFRQGARYYRNGRDWAKEQRDRAIRRANERVDEYYTGPAIIDMNFAQASSFASGATLDGTFTIEALSEESRTSLTESTNTTTYLQQPESSLGELAMDHRATVKRSNEHSNGSPQSRRKRRNTDDFDYELSQQSELQSPESYGLSQQFQDQDLEQEQTR